MSLVLVDGYILAIDGILAELTTAAPTLLPPALSITSIDKDSPADDATVAVSISGRDPAGATIGLHFFVVGTVRGIQSRSIANANGTAEVTLPGAFIEPGETLSCRATTDSGVSHSNPSATATLTYSPGDTGGTLPATLPFTL